MLYLSIVFNFYLISVGCFVKISPAIASKGSLTKSTLIAIVCVVIALFAIGSITVFAFFVIYFSLSFFALNPYGTGARICKMSLIAAFSTLISYVSISAAIRDLLFESAAIWCEPVA